jgi:NitT/TauT family transport system permease protein
MSQDDPVVETATEIAEDEVRREPGTLWLSLLVFVVFIAGWEAIIRIFQVPKIIVPAPSAIAVSLWEGLRSGELIRQFGVTFYETVIGFLVGTALGLVLGILIGMSRLLERVFYPYVVAFQTIPKVAIAPIIVIWFGYGIASKVVITATIAFFPVLANTIVGLGTAPDDQIELLLAYSASRWQVFWVVRWRQALPYIFVGLDVAIVLSVIGAIVGEFVGSQAGLGFMILQRDFYFDMPGVFAILLVLSLLGIGLHLLMNFIRRRVVFWMRSSDELIMGA